MTAQLRIFTETAATVLAVVPPGYDERLLQRAGDAAEILGADLHVFCPVTRMPAPHSAVTPESSTATAETKVDRDRARRIAGNVQQILNEHNIDACVGAGPSPSLTDGILNEAAKLKPDLLVLPFIRPDNSRASHDLIRYETVWSRLGIPVWVVNSESPGGTNVAGYVVGEKRRHRKDRENSRVSAAVSRLASRLGSDPHLLCCLKPPAALAIAQEALAPPRKSIAEVDDDAMARAVHKAAGVYAIPKEHVAWMLLDYLKTASR